VRKYVEGESVFLANYSDGLSDIPIDHMIEDFYAKDAVASFAAVRTWQSFHSIRMGKDGYVNELGEIRDNDFFVNGGYFTLRKEVFDFIKPGDELVEAPFHRLIEARKLIAYKHTGFWRAMDTLKDKITFDRMYAAGEAPWQLWN